MYEGDVWEPLAVWLLGGFEDAHERRLSFNQFMLQDGRTYRTYEAHERLHAICTRLGNPELTDGAFGENHAASTIGKNGWKPTSASLLQDIPKDCVEQGHRLGIQRTMIRGLSSCYPASFQGMGEAKPYFEPFGTPNTPHQPRSHQ